MRPAPRARALDNRLLHGGPLGPSEVIQLQRAAGNQATRRLLSGPVVQREVMTKAKDLDFLVKGGALKAAVGRSTFTSIRGALAWYEKADTPQAQMGHLQKVERLILEWMNTHAGDHGAIDRRRRSVLDKLFGEVSSEQVKISRAQAQDIYMGNVRKSGEQVDAGSDDPADKYALGALTTKSKAGVEQGTAKPGRQMAESAGLTEAEVAAIQIFTGEDYKYINPATANSSSWLQSNKATGGEGFERGASDKTMKEEGSLHVGVAMQGIVKLPPYAGQVFRGASYSADEFHKEISVGKQFTFNAFASSSKDRGVAEKFAKDTGKEFAVVFVIEQSGGRDVSKLSLAGGEKEVTLLPGSKYSVKALSPIAMPSRYAGGGEGSSRQWYEAVLSPG